MMNIVLKLGQLSIANQYPDFYQIDSSMNSSIKTYYYKRGISMTNLKLNDVKICEW